MPETTIKPNIEENNDLELSEEQLEEISETKIKKSGPKLKFNLFNLGHEFLAPVYISFLLILLMFGVGSIWIKVMKPSPENFITVTGVSQEDVQNEIATFNATVQSQNEDKQAAVDEATKKAQDLVSFIKSSGIEDKDIQTRNVNVYQMQDPVFEGEIRKSVPGDWIANISVEVTYRDTETVEEFTSQLASQDIYDMYGPNFSMDSKKLDESDLLDSALKDAEQKAKVLAGSSNRKVGDIVNIVEGSSAVQPFGRNMFEMAGGLGGGIPLEPGSTEVSKVLTVTFELK